MSGLLELIQTLLDKDISPLAYRYFLLQTHYRKQLTFSWDALNAAKHGLEHLYSASKELPIDMPKQKNIETKFIKFINNDLFTPGALAFVWEQIKARKISQKTLIKFDQVLGLGIKENIDNKTPIFPKQITDLITQRNLARMDKDWEKSDKIRDKIEKMGYNIKDIAGNTVEITKK